MSPFLCGFFLISVVCALTTTTSTTAVPTTSTTAAATDYPECGYHFNDKNVTFDISPLTLTEQSQLNYYNVTAGDYHYLLNFCADVRDPPSQCIFNDKNSIGDEVYMNGSRTYRPENISSNVFQSNENYCYRLSGSTSESVISDSLTSYQLIDNDDPSFGFILHIKYGDYCGYQWPRGDINRETKIAFVCDPSIDNIPDKGETVTEPETCVYEIEIKTIYGCPLECGRDMYGSLCSNNGVCGYDFEMQTARCYCFGGFEGHYCNGTTTFLGQVEWYEAVTVNNDSNYVYTFETMYGYNITYDLQYIVDGYMSNDVYRLHDMNASNYYYFNLFDSMNDAVIDALGVCTRNDIGYDYGYIFQTVPNAPGAQCLSLGRDAPVIELYDETLPTKGVKLSYVNGDNSSSCEDGRRANIYFICPDSNQHERMDTMYGLNEEFKKYRFAPDETGCEYSIEIFTSVACPYQCITYDEQNDMLSQCNAAGICAYDFALDVTRCICEDIEVIEPADIQCYDSNMTYPPSKSPTESPTVDPNIDIAWYENVQIDETSNYIYPFESIFGYNVTYDLQYIIDGYLNGKYYRLTDWWSQHWFYLNLFNKTVGKDAVKGICDNNLPDYNYGYVYQARENSLETCFSLGRSGPTIELYDEYRPESGIRISFTGGDNKYCPDSKRRRTDINFICPNDGGTFERYDANTGLNDIYYAFNVYEPSPCEYVVDIITSAACPAQCITYDSDKVAVSECTANGVCGHDNVFDVTRCFCNNNMDIESEEDIFCANPNITYAPTPAPSDSPTEMPTNVPSGSPTLPPYITWVDGIVPNNESDYVFEFETNDGYNVTYDLYHVIIGYMDDKYYKLQDDKAHNVYFNLFNSSIINEHPNIAGICDANEANYSFGYIYQSHIGDPNVECRSIGREGPTVALYDDANPLKGVRLSYENGDDMGCQARRTDINLVCPDDFSQFEIYRSGSLNDRFSMFQFSEPSTCQYEITIETAAACPVQCMTYENEIKESISQCSTNGYCSYSGAVRCICNDNMIINDRSDIFCGNANITYPPTKIPTTDPTAEPTDSPTNEPTEWPTNLPTVAPTTPQPTPAPTVTEEYSLYGQWARYDSDLDLLFAFEIGVDTLCETVKFTFIAPGCRNPMWFGIGIGGDYGEFGFDSHSESDDTDASMSDSSDESEHSDTMNGYALISVPDGYTQQTFETTLQSGAIPSAQSSQDLRCTVTIENCVQTTVCHRDYATEDGMDFTEFVQGINPIIWAFGDVSSDYGSDTLQQHSERGRGDSFIELEGEESEQCGYAKSVNDASNNMESEEGMSSNGNNGQWRLVSIILIIVLAVVVIAFCGFWYMRRKKANATRQGGYLHGRVQSMDGGFDNTQMASMDIDDVDSPKKDTTQFITKGNEDDDLL